MLSEKDAQNIADMENLRQQLVELMEDNERKEAIPIKEKNKVKKKKTVVLWRSVGLSVVEVAVVG